MVITQWRSKRKSTGKVYKKPFRAKRRYEKGNAPTLTSLGARKIKTIRTRAGQAKTRIMRSDIVNVYNPKTKKCEKAKIKSVTENPANRHYVRRNIMTKGTVIETDKGKAKITSRPGQDGTINAVLL